MTFMMWSPLHIFMIISPVLLIIILYQLTKDNGKEENRRVGIILSTILVGLLVLRNIEIWMNKGFSFHYELVPLQVCHFANIVLLYAFYKRNNTAFALAFTLNLIPAYLSVVFANGLENYTTIINFRGLAYILGHIGISVVTIWAYMVGFIQMTFKTYLKTLRTMLVLFFSGLIINNLFNSLLNQPSNYFYTQHPEKGTPLEWFYEFGRMISIGAFDIHPIYLILLSIFGSFLTFVLYFTAFALPTILERSEQIKRS
ncbi:MAG: hypothetical protein UMR38_00710 [Candidatus Izemoplasma sp.]|nr:hypothetical protein [Candidatus Izemoplasma sp.]